MTRASGVIARASHKSKRPNQPMGKKRPQFNLKFDKEVNNYATNHYIIGSYPQHHTNTSSYLCYAKDSSERIHDQVCFNQRR